MAVSGVVLLGFVIGHLAGNLQLYAGPEVINRYAETLHSLPGMVWPVRLVLLAAFLLHAWSSLQLFLKNRAARRVGYRMSKDVATTYAARTMVWSGPILLLFIAYHLAHLTLGVLPGHEFVRLDVYNNVVRGFQTWWVSAIYIVANIALGVHLFHGIWSFFQSLGINHPKYNAYRKELAVTVAAAITLGNLSFPIAVMTGLIAAGC